MKYFTMYYILGLAPRFYTDTLQALHGAFCTAWRGRWEGVSEWGIHVYHG